MKDISRIKKELGEHIRKSSFDHVHDELKKAGLYTYSDTNNVISYRDFKVSLKSEVSTSIEAEEIKYDDVMNYSKPNTYRLAS